jgi:hypothetical protein
MEDEVMKAQLRTLSSITTLIVFLIGSVYAAPGGGGGPGGGGPGGGGGGGGSSAPDLGDLFVLYRDPGGVPYLTADSCWQPLPSAACPADCIVDGVPSGVGVVPVDPTTCGVLPACATCTQEVDFGRINDIRSPDTVFDSQLEDVIVNLATSDCLSLDPAGRMVTSRVSLDDEGNPVVSSGAIDSPLQNLAIYRQLLLTGTLGIPLPGDALSTAARGLGAGSDKSGFVSVDMVAYVNQIMGLTDDGVSTILDPKICINMKSEVTGQVQLVRKCFLDYSAYGYNRATNFGALPAPAYIPEDDPQEGTFEFLYLISDTPPTFGIMTDLITTAVFDDEAGFTDGNIGGFAQAADDARAVIDYMHSNPLPAGFATAVPCGADPGGDTNYDVSISDVSGLQVPVQMVDGSEGREFTVAVGNAGPDAASGSVTVTAIAANGALIEGSPWTFEFTDLAAGASESWITFFTINVGARTTINWTATAVAQFDVNLGNNTVYETTSVKVTGGGGGGGKP